MQIPVLKTEEKIIAMLKTVYDPEIPVNIYDLGLIYKIDLQDDGASSVRYDIDWPPIVLLLILLWRMYVRKSTLWKELLHRS